LDYGCIVYGSARGAYLQMLDPVQNHALVYVFVLIERRHPPACDVFLQTNQLSMYGGESSQYFLI